MRVRVQPLSPLLIEANDPPVVQGRTTCKAFVLNDFFSSFDLSAGRRRGRRQRRCLAPNLRRLERFAHAEKNRPPNTADRGRKSGDVSPHTHGRIEQL